MASVPVAGWSLGAELKLIEKFEFPKQDMKSIKNSI